MYGNALAGCASNSGVVRMKAASSGPRARSCDIWLRIARERSWTFPVLITVQYEHVSVGRNAANERMRRCREVRRGHCAVRCAQAKQRQCRRCESSNWARIDADGSGVDWRAESGDRCGSAGLKGAGDVAGVLVAKE